MKRIYDTLYIESTDSTNNEAKRLPANDNLAVVTAYGQTAGRGQRGNSWHSTPGLNLTFSILVRWGRDGVPEMPAKEQFAISRIATVSLAGLLATRGIRASIKWPNDIYVNDRKICGILIENTINGDKVSSSIIGIGLNVNETDFPASLPNPTSVKCEYGRETDIRDFLNEYIGHFDSCLTASGTAEGRKMLEEKYLQEMYRKDVSHRYTDTRSGKEFTGVIRGVAPNACLLMENEEGGLQEFAFKEISYII